MDVQRRWGHVGASKHIETMDWRWVLVNMDSYQNGRIMSIGQYDMVCSCQWLISSGEKDTDERRLGHHIFGGVLKF